MELKSDSKLVQWAYIFNEDDVPNQTSLCAFFWRAFFFVPLGWVGIVSFLSLVVWLIASISWKTRGAFPVGMTLFILVLYQLLEPSSRFQVWRVNRENRKWDQTGKRKEPSVFVQGLKNLKGKFCPIIFITRSE